MIPNMSHFFCSSVHVHYKKLNISLTARLNDSTSLYDSAETTFYTNQCQDVCWNVIWNLMALSRKVHNHGQADISGIKSVRSTDVQTQSTKFKTNAVDIQHVCRRFLQE